MTNFLFVRHGESTGNLTPEYICGRSNHLPLTGSGREQARLLGEYLGAVNYFPNIIISSGATRANETAELATTAAAYYTLFTSMNGYRKSHRDHTKVNLVVKFTRLRQSKFTNLTNRFTVNYLALSQSPKHNNECFVSSATHTDYCPMAQYWYLVTA